MADETGSIGPPQPDIELEWDFRFWDVREGDENFGNRTLNKGGYGNMSKKCDVSLGAGTKSVRTRFRTFENIGGLTHGREGDLVTLVLTPPAGHDSGRPAGPDTDSPRASAGWNKPFEMQMRELKFRDLELDWDGYFKVRGGAYRRIVKTRGDTIEVALETTDIKGEEFDMYECFIADDDAREGLGAHGYAKIYPRKHKRGQKQDVQQIKVDWYFDVLRPTMERKHVYTNHYQDKLFPGKKRKDLSKAEKKQVDKAKSEDADNKKAPWIENRLYNRGKFNEKFLVIHITTGNRVESQVQTLTTAAAIHYLVCLNGHVIKIVEDDMGCYHAGWEDVAVWRDFDWKGKIDCNRTSIGIEHLGKAKVDWPQAEIDGSVRIAKKICAAHGIASCNVVRHRDLGGAKKGAHVHGKECPGEAAPWWAYQEAGVAIWPIGTRNGETEPAYPEGDGFYHGIFDLVTYIDDALTGAKKTPENEARQIEAIKELQGYLALIGYRPVRKDKSNAGKYDDAATHCVTMCQERFMIARSNEAGDTALARSKDQLGRVDRKTAEIIYAVCQHGSGELPPLNHDRGKEDDDSDDTQNTDESTED